jgi:hypothetical protein
MHPVSFFICIICFILWTKGPELATPSSSKESKAVLSQQGAAPLMRMNVPVSENYRGPLWAALALQAVIAARSVLMLDSGVTARCCLIALLGFWAGTAVVLLRRRRNPARTDLWLIRWGYLPLVVAVPVIARFAAY